LTIVAIVFLSTAVAVDRVRAEWILFALMVAACIVAFLLISHDLLFPEGWLVGAPHEQAVDCAGLGTIIAGAACIRSIERHETRRAQRPKTSLVPSLIVFGAAFVICCAALAVAANRQAIFATAFGLGSLACIVIIRRFGLGLLGIGGMVLLGTGIALVVMVIQPTKRGTSVALAFAPDSAAAATALSQRMLDDAPLVGTGAGTFLALAPIYREMGDPPSASVATTAAGTFAIELGPPMLWLISTAAIGSMVILFRAALKRGRDSFYPAMAGAALLALLLLAFTNAGLLGNAVGVIAATIVGVGFAQSKSRSAQP
jgi:hypothetical protein